MMIGYARVSTDEQNMALQLDALCAAGCEKIFTDHGVSGVTIKRDGLRQAIGAVGRGDVLVVWKLDRLGRSLGFLIDLIRKLQEDGANFHSLTDGIDTATASGTLIFHVMGALAQFERALIQERTKAGIEAARKRGVVMGRRKAISAEQLAHARQLIDGGERPASVARMLNVGRSTLYRALAEG